MSDRPVDRVLRALFGGSSYQQLLFPDVCDGLLSDDGDVTLDFVRAIADLAGRSAVGLICPDTIVDFVKTIVSEESPRLILDPWAGVGSLVIPVAESVCSSPTVRAIEPRTHLCDVGKELHPTVQVGWIEESAEQWLKDNDQRFDLIVCSPPFGGRPKHLSLSVNNDLIDLRDTPESLTLLLSSLRLSDDGKCIFIVPPSFVRRHRHDSVLSALHRFDLHLDAYIYLQSGVFAPSTMMPAALVVIRRGNPQDVFVGELTKNRERNELLADNLKERCAGTSVGLGALVAPDEFRGYQRVVANKRVESLSRSFPYKPVTLTDISLEINRLHPQRDEQFEDLPNSIYVPLFGIKPVSASVAELPIAGRHCVQVVLDPEQATAEYVTGFLNTPLGEAVREQVAVEGAAQRNITRKSIGEILLFLPPMPLQLATIDIQTTITNFVSELRDLEHQLWNQPKKLEDVSAAVRNVNRADRFTDWLDTLPFPLATILWTYQASGSNDKIRYEHLLHFFEGLAQFFAVALLSGFLNDQERCQDVLRSLRESLDQEHLSVERGTFGTWVKVVEKLSKAGRSLANGDDEDKLRCRQMFRTSDHSVLDLLFAKKLIHLLHQANASRNRWVGHGGIVSADEAQQRHIFLKNLLSQLRALFGQTWERSILVRPRSSRFIKGTFEYEAERLVGTRTPFETIQLRTNEPMEDGSLYLTTTGSATALKLLPLIRVMPSPRTAHNACYFYNRREGDSICFVSYHFEQEAEIVDHFADTNTVLQMLVREGNRGGTL